MTTHSSFIHSCNALTIPSTASPDADLEAILVIWLLQTLSRNDKLLSVCFIDESKIRGKDISVFIRVITCALHHKVTFSEIGASHDNGSDSIAGNSCASLRSWNCWKHSMLSILLIPAVFYGIRFSCFMSKFAPYSCMAKWTANLNLTTG